MISLASIAIGLLVIYSAWGLLKEAIAILMERTPGHLDIDQVHRALAQTPGVCSVHDLHIWGMSTTETALTAHLVIPNPSDDDALLAKACAELHDQFGIEHATLQVERGDPAYPCRLAPAETV